MPFFQNPVRILLVSVSGLILSTAGGCSNGTAAVPSGEVARKALEAALDSWREGGKPGELPGTEPRVEIHDTPWASGQHLASYEILGEESGKVEKRFAVRLSLAKPDRVEEVRVPRAGGGAGDDLSRRGLRAQHQHGRRPADRQEGATADDDPTTAVINRAADLSGKTATAPVIHNHSRACDPTPARAACHPFEPPSILRDRVAPCAVAPDEDAPGMIRMSMAWHGSEERAKQLDDVASQSSQSEESAKPPRYFAWVSG